MSATARLGTARHAAVGGGGERTGGRFCRGSSACSCMESHVVGQPFTAGHAGGERPSRARVGRTARAHPTAPPSTPTGRGRARRARRVARCERAMCAHLLRLFFTSSPSACCDRPRLGATAGAGRLDSGGARAAGCRASGLDRRAAPAAAAAAGAMRAPVPYWYVGKAECACACGDATIRRARAMPRWGSRRAGTQAAIRGRASNQHRRKNLR